jgi:hypothetical protein
MPRTGDRRTRPDSQEERTGGGDTRLPIAEEGRLEPPALVVHGRTGHRSSRDMSEADRQRYRDANRAALRTGHELLTSGAGAVDVVVAAVTAPGESGAPRAGNDRTVTC